MTEKEKQHIKDRLLDLIDKLQGVRELVEMNDPDLARVQLMDVAGQVQRVGLKLR